MAATDNDALLKAMDQLMKEEDRASVIEYAKQLSTKGGDVVGTMRKMSQQGVDTKKDAAMWKKRALLTAAVAVVVCAVMFGLMIASAELSKESRVVTLGAAGDGRRLESAGGTEFDAKGNKLVFSGNAKTILSTTTVGDKVHNLGRRLDTSDGTRSLGVLDADDLTGEITHLFLKDGGRRLDDDGRELQTETITTYKVIKVTLDHVNRRLDDGGDDTRSLVTSTLGLYFDGGCFHKTLPDGEETLSEGGDCSSTATRRLSARRLTLDSARVGLNCNCVENCIEPSDIDCRIEKSTGST